MTLEVNIVQEQPPDRTGMARWTRVRHVCVDISGGKVPTEDEMQRIAFAAKMEYAKQMRGRVSRRKP